MFGVTQNSQTKLIPIDESIEDEIRYTLGTQKERVRKRQIGGGKVQPNICLVKCMNVKKSSAKKQKTTKKSVKSKREAKVVKPKRKQNKKSNPKKKKVTKKPIKKKAKKTNKLF